MNGKKILAIIVGTVSLATAAFAVRLVWFSPDTPQETPGPPASDETITQTHELPDSIKKLSGPYTHKNLTFYLAHGESTMTGKTPLTLEEAMDRRLVVIHETGEVNELSIENTSHDHEVFVQAGDIVKGGRQDRMIGVDLMVPKQSGRIPIESFCVESQRWNTRTGESGERFGSSSEYAPSKDLKLAAKHNKSQGEVWDKVEESQGKLSAATNSDTTSNVSRSSLPLTMQNQRVRSESDEYAKFLSDIVGYKTDVIGIVMVINGKINSADTYSSSALFVKLWPKLLNAGSIEAVAESREQGSVKNAITTDDVRSFLATSEQAAITEERAITERVRLVTRSSDKAVFITTHDRDNVLHRNYLMK